MNRTEITLPDGTTIRAGEFPVKQAAPGLRSRFGRMFKAAQDSYQQGGVPQAIRDAYAEWMSPLPPLSPTVPVGTPLRVQDFPVGYNIAWIPRSYEGISFEQLRQMGDSDYLMRGCIETVKDQIAKLDWRIGLKPKDNEPHIVARRNSEADPRVKKIRTLFTCPDGIHGFSEWLRMLVEDMLVIDAACLLVARDDGGDGPVKWLIPADGGMVHVCIDKQGRRPLPPIPAYQQIAKGMIVGNLTTREMVYMPRNLRTHRIYGMSPVEQMIFFMNIVLRRDISKLSYYTAGNVPEALISAPQSWSPDQIKQFQGWLDSVLSGQLAARRKMTMVPNMGEPGKPGNIRDAVMFTKDAILQDEFDEWRARVTSYFLGLPPNQFVKMNNRATAQQQQQQALEEGLLPKKFWIKEKIDFIIQSPDLLGEPDCEFAWEDEQEVDPAVQAKVDDLAVRNGTRSIDELRLRDGLEPFGIGPMIVTMQGPIMLDDIKSGEGRFLPNKTPDPALNPQLGPDGKPVAGGKNGKKPLPLGAKDNAAQKLLKAADVSKKKLQVSSDPSQLPEKSQKRVKVAGRSISRFLKKQGSATAQKLAEAYSHFAKADEDDMNRVNQILSDLDLDWVSLTGMMTQPLVDTARDGASQILLEIGFTDEAGEIFGVVNQDALDYGLARGAEMVGKKIVNGELVDNPDAAWAITDTTREELRQLVAKAFSDGMTPRELEQAIEDSFQFSDARAQMIARTEMAKAHVEGALSAAKESGVVTKKFIMLSGDHDLDDECDDCQADGQIDLGADFSAGEPGPPFHPNCMCTLEFIYGEVNANA